MEKYTGLTTKEAKQLLTEYGHNDIQDTEKHSAFTILLRQIQKNFIVYLLFFAATISFFVGKDITGYTIVGVILMVVIAGFIQEYRAEKAVQSLKNMLTPVSILLRDGHEVEVPSREIVPGDIIVLGTGERIPADCAILAENELRVNEAVLTGESSEIKKNMNGSKTPEEKLLFMGTYIVNGRCTARVTHTGMSTKFGKIARLISSAEKELPLQKKINYILRYMTGVAIAVSSATGLLLYFRAETITPEIITNILILVIALCVSAFPEGFPVVLITTLATGASRMAKQNAIVNRMSIIETLGETTIICSDKTGTITKGEMTINTILTSNEKMHVTGTGFSADGDITRDGRKVDVEKHPVLTRLFHAAVLCSNARIERTGEDNTYSLRGTPTEGALKILAAKASMFQADLKTVRLSEKPFNSDRKMMSVFCMHDDDHYVYAKGAPEILIETCKFYQNGEKITRMTEKHKETLLDENQKLNDQALRTLALAYKKTPSSKPSNHTENELVFLGIVGMEDPPREEVRQALAVCTEAGIRVMMITGDNRETALSIGKDIGLTGGILEGKDLDTISDEELMLKLKKTSIFARVRPEHKLRIVRLLKSMKEIVTMTGDGVNDAPALKEAHIGVAMGKNGTDVSRSAADLTLKDDNFATIVVAIKEGRTIFNNIRKFVTYQLSANFAELFIIFTGVLMAPVFGWDTPLLLALHILFMNLVTDNMSAITLGLNPTSNDIMRDKPRRNAQILSKPLILLLAFNGTLLAILTLVVYYISFNIFGESVEHSRTTALVTLIVLEIASAYNFRSFRKPTIGRSLFVNKYLVVASMGSLTATLIILYTPARFIFETMPLNPREWLLTIAAAVYLVIVIDYIKLLCRRSGVWLANIE